MTCIYAEVTKSGRLKCTYDEKGKDGEKNISSPPNSYKMCPFQAYCRKLYEWELRGQNRCRYYKQGREVESNG